MQQLRAGSPTKRIVIAALVCAAVASCSAPDEWVEQRRYAMGTWVDSVYLTADSQAQIQINSVVDDLLRQYEVDYYAWADGELARLNAALGAGRSFTASAELAALLTLSRSLSAASGGFFDPGVGALVEAWGFHAADQIPGAPAATFLEQWHNDPASIADLRIDGLVVSTNRRVSTDPTRLVIDLGGIAKGEVIDRLLERFIAVGIDNVLINAGGDVRVRGTRGERRWSIGIQAPRSAGLIGSIELNDGEAAFTSGDYERFYEADGGRRHHLIDPKTGHPAAHTQSLTVIADNGALADAAATALFTAGPVRWRTVAAALGITAVLRVDASGSIEMTPAMRERVRMRSAAETATMIHEQRLARL